MGKRFFPLSQWIIYILFFKKLPWFRVAQFDNIEINPPPKKKKKTLQKHLTKVS
jgi:hypothetical protein